MESINTTIDYNLSADESEELALNPPVAESFPILIFLAANFKDMVDIGSLGLFGIIATLFFAIIIYFWIFSKSTFIRRRLTRRFLRRYVFVFIIGIIPGVNFIPETTILVLLIHYRETKIVKGFYKSLEVLH